MTPVATMVSLIVTAVVTYIAFQRPDIKNRLMFDPHAILRHKEYDRMLTSGFIHADWFHFGFNAYSFYTFGQTIELLYGAKSLLLIYLAAILGGSLVSLAVHRHHDYRALGASGGVCGVIFASIFLTPGSGVMMFPFPVSIPAYIYAPAFLVVSFWRHRSGSDNIGHDAHIGGAIIGLLVATALYPSFVLAEPWMFATVLGLALVILLFLTFDPLHLWGKFVRSTEDAVGGERGQRYAQNRERNQKMAALDELLDKVAKNGVHSLSNAEREKLERLSKEIR